MLEFKVPLYFNPDTALFFTPSYENIEQEVMNSLEYSVEDDFFEKACKDAKDLDIDEENLEVLSEWLTVVDVDSIMSFSRIDMDSISFQDYESENTLEYSVRVRFDDADWEEENEDYIKRYWAEAQEG